MKVAIYYTTHAPDAAVMRGLNMAGCKIQFASTLGDTLQILQQVGARMRTLRTLRKRRSYEPATPFLVADVQSGALALLDLMQEHKIELPPAILVDEHGKDIQAALKALQHGVREYFLPENMPDLREQRTKQLVERTVAEANRTKPVISFLGFLNGKGNGNGIRKSSIVPLDSLKWDPVSLTINIGDEDYLRLSPMEGRTFDLLFNRRGDTVSIEELIDTTLTERDGDEDKNIQLLRTHLARLRRRLADHPQFGYRIENMRGTGYTLI